MSAAPDATVSNDVRFYVLADPDDPVLLARVRWPDVFQAVSPARPEWHADPGLFDLPYDPSSTAVTTEQAMAIAAAWGVDLPLGERAEPTRVPQLLRRMPADWSNLSPVERRTWLVEPQAPARRSWFRFGRSRSTAAADATSGAVLASSEQHAAEATGVLDLTGPTPVIDLTGSSSGASVVAPASTDLVTAEDA